MTTMVEAKNLTKYYGDFLAIEEVNFQVQKGEIVGFLGPNGAGKTTLMRMLTGFLAPSAARAALAGFDVRDERIEASRRLGYLPESGPLYPDMTPLELLRFFGEARELPGRTVEERIEALVEICSLQLVL